LAAPPYAISATQGDGVRTLFEAVLAACEKKDAPDVLSELPESAHFAVIGRPNVGKSTLVNRLLGTRRMVVADHPGTTRDTVRVPFRDDEHEYVLVDTPGVRRRSKVENKLERFSV